MVPFGLVTACRLAGSPTRVSPLLVKATTEGVSRLPSWLAMTVGAPPSITATTLLVVPRSIPMIVSPSATVDLLLGLSLGRINHVRISLLSCSVPRRCLARTKSRRPVGSGHLVSVLVPSVLPGDVHLQ